MVPVMWVPVVLVDFIGKLCRSRYGAAFFLQKQVVYPHRKQYTVFYGEFL